MTTDEQVLRLRSEALEVEVLPALGGRIHRIRTADGLDLLRTPDDHAAHRAQPFHWGSYPLVPWANRVWGGRLEWDGRVVDLPVNYDDGTALHGEAYVRPWERTGDGALTFRGGDLGFPWPYVASQSFALDGATFAFTLAVTNVGDEDMPAGLGIHPWWTCDRITLDAASWSPTIEDARAGHVEPVAGGADLRAGGPIEWGWDSVWADIGRRSVTLGWTDAGVTAHLGFSASARFVTIAAITEVGAVAVEPQTQQVARPERVAPGEVLAVSYSLTVRASA